MDFDLLSGYLQDPAPTSGQSSVLLSDLPYNQLTHNEAAQPIDAEASSDAQSRLPSRGPFISENHAGVVISKIEDIFEPMIDCIFGRRKELVINLRTRPQAKQDAQNGPDAPTRRLRPNTRSVTFPSKSPQEAWKFTAILRILELSHEALITGVVITKRDIYYRDPELFVKQSVVDRYVDDIAYTLGVERGALNIVAAAKGLIAGPFSITRKDQTVIDYSTESEGSLVPNVKDIASVQINSVQWILVIEKEATFRTLATSEYWKDGIAGQGIIITAKGYPDISSRKFLHLFSNQHPEIPIFALVDYDPDGIAIMSTYKHGSVALAHESSTLTVPTIKWLGVRSSDFVQLGEEVQGLLKLSARDRRVAQNMLQRDMPGDWEWKRELQVMLMLNVKAEIQILGNSERLGEWLDGKLLELIAND